MPANLSLPPLVVLLFLPLLVTKIDFVFCPNYHYCYFSKTPLAMQLPTVKKRAAAHLLSVSFHVVLHGVTYVRRVINGVVTSRSVKRFAASLIIVGERRKSYSEFEKHE